jgi:hypothetical protein
MSAPTILLSNLPEGKTMDERTARALMDIAIKANVDALLADRMSLGQLRQRVDSFPDDIRDYVELATFNELARRWQAGQCPWSHLGIFAPSWIKQELNG